MIRSQIGSQIRSMITSMVNPDGGGGLPEFAELTFTGGGSNLLAEESKSLKLSPYNGHVSGLDDDYGIVKLSPAVAGTLFEIGVDGLFYIVIDIPFESTFENKLYNLFGGAFNGGRTMHIDYAGDAYFSVADRNKFRITIRGTTGTTVSFFSAAITTPKILLAITKNGNDFAVKTIDCETGALTNGGTQTSSATELNLPLDFWVGYAGATSVPARPMTGNASMFTGSIESFGYIDITPTDAMLINYATGDDVDTAFGLSNVRWARDLKGVDAASLAPLSGTTDPTASLTTSGNNFKTGGSIRRATKAKYLQMSDNFEGYVASVKKDVTTGIFPVSGSSSETSGIVQCRVIWDDDATSSNWVDMAEIDGSGNWTGKMKALPMSEWGYVETRLKDDTAITGISRKKSAFGYKIYFPNQSQCRIMATDDGLNTTLQSASRGAVYKLGAVTDATLQSYVFDSAFANSDGLVSMIDYLYGLTGKVTTIISDAISGTSAAKWIDDSSIDPASRNWSDTVDLLAVTGNDFASIIWQWGSSDNIGLDYGDVFDAVLNGTGPLTADHYINDGTFETGFEFAVSLFSRSTTTGVGPFDFDDNNVGITRQGQANWLVSNPTISTFGSYVNDMAIDGTGPHQPLSTVKGSTRIALRMAESAARALGFSSDTNPTISGIVLTNSTTITGTVTLPNGGAIKTDGLAGLQGFEISVDSGTTWSRSGFTGVVSTSTTFTLTKTSGTWIAGAMIRYQSGSPLGYGSSVESSDLYEGCLYDGTSFDSNLGIPIEPMLEETL